VRDFEPGTEHRSEAQLFGDGGGSTPRNGDVSAMSFDHSGGKVAPPSNYGEPRNFFLETFLRLHRAMRTRKKGASRLRRDCMLPVRMALTMQDGAGTILFRGTEDVHFKHVVQKLEMKYRLRPKCRPAPPFAPPPPISQLRPFYF
jgi:hypothetical protein